ncbi:MAG: tRNA lysidine(34) synthetase TilS [Desulfobacteraceae bacterium 4484_190.2]|nr:MAG: tRNA lysidine(34) synthetase TilS [Desulfobacteraceae bacterium 4484_190.2]
MGSINDTIKKVRHTIIKYNMIRDGDRVVVPDSVCLLDILQELEDELRIELVVAHFDHGLRPDEDEAENRFVESLAVALTLPFETKKADPGMGQESPSVEERARHARYQFLEGVKEKFSAQKIATGHNLNDQAETVLMRLLRGSGPSGLAGIPPCREEKMIRPLIEITRGEIESYLERKGLTHITDSSNFQACYLRNKIRLELLPRLQEYQPRIVELLGRTADIMRNDEAWLAAGAEEWVERSTETKGDGEIRIPLSSFIILPEALKNRVIRYALKMTGGSLRRVSLRHIENINQMAMGKKPQALINLPNGIIAKKVYGRLIFTGAKDTRSEGFFYFLDGPGKFDLKALGRTILLTEMKKAALSDMGASRWCAFLNADHLTYPLVIRNVRPGDKFIPFGMSGHKKLKDFFMDLKVPSEARAQTPILFCRDIPVWVCGFRIDDRFKISPDTKKILKVTFDAD